MEQYNENDRNIVTKLVNDYLTGEISLRECLTALHIAFPGTTRESFNEIRNLLVLSHPAGKN